MEFRDYLKFMVVKDASDLYLTTGAPPTARIQGMMMPVETTPM
jgi:twitching motility protein PilU